MTSGLTNTQIDRLGDRLRKGPFAEADLKALDDYRRSFGMAYASVVRAIRDRTQLEPTGRPAKSTGALIEKLRRESIRLTQVQDIAGCRVIVPDIVDQDRVVSLLRTIFPEGSVVDRREHPSYGYRAVHIIAHVSGSLVEIQVRSSLQHLWAELSEKVSDVVDPAIKYGGGPPHIRDRLAKGSALIAAVESVEAKTGEIEAAGAEAKQAAADLAQLDSGTAEDVHYREFIAEAIPEVEQLLADAREEGINNKSKAVSILNEMISAADRFKGKNA